jgi:DNA-binding MarR family transcriptional regulator
VLGARGLSPTQYNVLRVLRGAGDDGLCRNEVRDRLITRMPDVTRLLDRMEEAGLVSRVRSTADRRLVTTTLTARGRALVDELDDDVARAHEQLLGHLDDAQLHSLIDLLSLARARP